VVQENLAAQRVLAGRRLDEEIDSSRRDAHEQHTPWRLGNAEYPIRLLVALSSTMLCII
jgi:hypothetical protein